MAEQPSDNRSPVVPPADGEPLPPDAGAIDTPHASEADDAAGGPTVPSADEEVAAELGDFA